MFLSQVFSLVLSLSQLFNCLHPEGASDPVRESNNQI